MYKLFEAVGNFSQLVTRPNPIKELETFDSLDELSEFLEARVNEDIRANETEEDIKEYREHLEELYFSYYSIEEITA